MIILTIEHYTNCGWKVLEVVEMGSEPSDLAVFSVTYCTCLFVLIFIGFIEWNRRKFIKYQNEDVMIKRYGYITVIEAKLSILHFVFVFIYEIFDGLYWSSLNHEETYFLIKRLCYLLHLIFLQCSYCILVNRFWLLYYDILLAQVSANKKWKKIINQNYDYNDNNSNKGKLNWFLLNRDKYGNFKWIIKRFTIPYILISSLCFIIVVIIKIIYGNNSYQASIAQAIELIFFILPCISMFVIYLKLPKLRDNLYILLELKYVCISLVILNILIPIEMIVGLIENQWNQTSQFTVNNILQNLYYLDQFATIMISTWWVLKKVRIIISMNKISRKNINKLGSRESTTNYSSENSSLPLRRFDRNKYKNIEYQLIQSLSDQDEFDQFMDYYAMDLNIKKLLAFIELIQFQQMVSNAQIMDINGNRNGSLCQRVEFHESIPKSFIVFSQEINNNNDYDIVYQLKLKCHQIFEKYINYGARYEIDIDDNNRRSICNKMDNKLEWLDEYHLDRIQLKNMLNPICNEIFESMIHSFYRFKENSF